MEFFKILIHIFRSWESSEFHRQQQQQQQQRRYRPLAGNWIDQDDEQYDLSMPQRRHSGKNGASFASLAAMHSQIQMRTAFILMFVCLHAMINATLWRHTRFYFIYAFYN